MSPHQDGQVARAPDRENSSISPRAIRVSLAGGSIDVGLDPCVVEPADDTRPVHIDGQPTLARLRMLDGERAVLVGAAGAPGDALAARVTDEAQRVLILAAPAGSPSDRSVERREVVVDGWRVEVELESEARVALRALARRGRAEGLRSGPTEVRAMIPGVILGVSVAPGDTVHAGQQLAIVEAMKMQNEVRAPRDGNIERVAVGPGTKIEAGDLLLVIN